jgi:predicted outer membrane repeat protein
VYDNEVIDCVFTNNTAKNGGATYRSDAFGCEFTNNRATESGGAMYGDEIYYRNNATYCIFTDNSAKNGGAVYMTIVNYSDFINNSASENGGAMYNSTGTNCYFINNSASQKGGAMYNSTGIYCYFRDNNAQTGGDDAYASELVKFSTELTATAKIITVYDAENYLVISLKDQFGNPFIGYDVSVIINGRTFTVCTQEDGRAMMPTDELAPGKYNAKITFEGDSNYAGSTAFSQITVKKAKAKIIAKKKTFKRKVKTKKYAVTLYAQEYLLDNLKVTLKIGKKTYSAKTNSNGKATFKIKKLKKKGKYSATVKFAGNSYYTAYSIKTKITVK